MGTSGEARKELSIVIPAYNEAGNLKLLVEEIVDCFSRLGPTVPSYEIVIVDDCSTDETLSEAKECMNRYDLVRVFHHESQGGKSAALRSAFRNTSGAWIATLDGDGQNDPDDLAKNWEQIKDGSRNLIYAGVRKKRNDGVVKMLTSKVANKLRRAMLGDDTRDTGCGFKVMPDSLVKDLPYFDNMHRFFPALAKLNGYEIAEFMINDRPRQHGQSKYGFFDRASVAILDLIGVYWLKQRRYRAGPTRKIELHEMQD